MPHGGGRICGAAAVTTRARGCNHAAARRLRRTPQCRAGERACRHAARRDGGPACRPNEDFQLVWRTVKGSWKVDGRRISRPRVHAGRLSDRDGEERQRRPHAASFVAPEDFGFVHDIVLQQGDRLLTQTLLDRHDGRDLGAKQGPLGTPIDGRGARASAGASSKAAGCCSTTTSSPASCRR